MITIYMLGVRLKHYRMSTISVYSVCLNSITTMYTGKRESLLLIMFYKRYKYLTRIDGASCPSAPEPWPLNVDDHVGRARPVVRQPLADRAQLLNVARVGA